MPSKPANNRVPLQPPQRPPTTSAKPSEEPREPQRPRIDPAALRREQGKRPEPPPVPPPVSAGPVDRVIELAFNPSREKLPEVTIIDRYQGKLLPQLTLVALEWEYSIEVAMYRQDSNLYKSMFKKEVPVRSFLLREFMHSLAQWQKSIGGKNLERATDIALAETETRGEEDAGEGSDAWKE